MVTYKVYLTMFIGHTFDLLSKYSVTLFIFDWTHLTCVKNMPKGSLVYKKI